MRRGRRAAAALVLTLALLEVALGPWVRTPAERMRDNPAMFRPSATLPYSLQPGFAGRHRSDEFDVGIRLNSHAYRGPEFGAKTRPRILCVGDSFTFGHGVEDDETWPARLQARLGPAVEVINAGYQGCFHPDGHYLYLATEAAALQPDLVLVGLFVGNDLDEPALPERTQDEWLETGPDGLPRRLGFRAATVRDGYYVGARQGWRGLPVLRDSRILQVLASAKPRRPRGPVNPLLYRPEWTPRTAEKLEVLDRLLGGMQASVPRLAVVLFPALEQVEERSTADRDLEHPQREILRILRARHLPALDLLEEFRAAGPDLYYPRDRHWRPAGQDLAAAAIARFVEDLDGTP